MVAKRPAPPDEVMINNQGYESKQKGPVRLSHSKHIEEYKVACTQCHHEYEEGKNVWEKGDLAKKCADCHSPLKEEGVVLNRLKTVYHKQCCNCHIQVNAQGKEAPFEKCTECHLGLSG
jgi:hypothetical protein